MGDLIGVHSFSLILLTLEELQFWMEISILASVYVAESPGSFCSA